MKYFAILKDSLKEALDSKVLLVLLILSTLIIVFVATVSFKPLSAERTMGQFFPVGNEKMSLPLVVALNSHKPQKVGGEALMHTMNALGQFRLVKVELLSGEADAPESEYELTISRQAWQAGNQQKAVDDNTEAKKAIRSIFEDAIELDYLRVGDPERIEPADPDKKGAPTLYRVKVQGTPRMLRIWAAEPSLFFGTVPVGGLSAPLGYQIYILTSFVLSIGTWIAVLTGVVITSFFIPNMLRKGTVDLLLVKPIHRWVLLFYKYIGGLTFIFLSTAFAVGGIWLVLGLRTGLWANGTLLLVLTITFFFAILYAVSTFVGVVTRSTVTAIMATIIAWFVFYLVGSAHQVFHNQHLVEQEMEKNGRPIPEDSRWGDGKAATVINVLHAISPRTADLNYLNDLIVCTDFMTGNLGDMKKFDTTEHNWWESLLVSTAWITIFLGLASAWFTYKDY